MAKNVSARIRKKDRKNVVSGIVHIQATFNNTVITITDQFGNVVSWASAGVCGFKGSKKSTPYAAQLAADKAAKQAMEHGLKSVKIQLKGPGSGRESAVRSLQGMGLNIISISDVTPLPHNGARPRKRRRV